MVKETKDIVLAKEYKFGEEYKKYIVTTQRVTDEGRTSLKVTDTSIFGGHDVGITIQEPIAYFSGLCEDGLLSGLVPDGKTALEVLKDLCRRGFSERYPDASADVYTRLTHEIEIIKQKGMVGGFLIIQDFIKYARSKNLMISPGSGALPGCLVAYCLGITRVDPIEESLSFERYLNIERETPSYCIRIDVQRGGRSLIFEYLSEKYGSGMPGLLKMLDISIKECVELSIIKDAIDNNISSSKGRRIEIAGIDKNDPAVFELLASDETEGILYFDRYDPHTYTTWCRPDDNGNWHEYHVPLVTEDAVLFETIWPKTMDELMAAISLDRCLPEEHVGKYLHNIKNQQLITYECSELEPILHTTYGCVIYQEQVMLILQDIGGFSPEKSDLCRRLLSKRHHLAVEDYRVDFVNGAKEKTGIVAPVANAIYEVLWDEARYCFNKSHIASFSLMIYEMAWLKVYFRSEFMEAVEKYRGLKSEI
ncbi:DNA polymerase III alpha subunit [Pseudobutyrivibrio ruminis]|uniref:DNA polymerase III alpha subunit n=2 Tax=Pseudobutyrivibrio ruminis TaxID=46206 RepID=A0A1H7M7R6_9FIRM|nr:DNA polymerase III alpha subunit [Pseudobutyrivibrio ruminis]